ncbi:hypothetical protein FRB94_013320 [Tulasnella sp. JGI-2019a]|nr:hypothetical protein FRB94_013320 [Tulasnella sp. JGI-2019a]
MVGRNAVKQITSPEQPRKNRYSGAIYALIQSGVMQSVTRILVIIAAATVNLTMTPIVGRIAVQVNGISATLLVLIAIGFVPKKGTTPRVPTTHDRANLQVRGSGGDIFIGKWGAADGTSYTTSSSIDADSRIFASAVTATLAGKRVWALGTSCCTGGDNTRPYTAFHIRSFHNLL